MTEHDRAAVDLHVGLVDLPTEILASIVRWVLRGPRATHDIAAVRASCSRFSAVSCLPLFQTGDVDPQLAPFARYADDNDEYSPASAPDGDKRLISAIGVARASRLRRRFVQTCVCYAIYSLMASDPADAIAPRPEFVPFPIFQRPESTALLMARVIKPVSSIFVYDHIRVKEYSDGEIEVHVCNGTVAKTLDPEPAALDEWTRDTINAALVAAAMRAMNATGSPGGCEIVADSIDLFEAYPECAGRFRATRPGFTFPAGWNRNLTRKCTLDISPMLDPVCRGSARATAFSPPQPHTMSFL